VAVTRAADRLLISGNLGDLSKADKSTKRAKADSQAGSWLSRTLTALLPSAILTTAEPPIQIIAPDGDWSVQLHIPAALQSPADLSRSTHPEAIDTGWARIDRGVPIAVSPYPPPLSGALPPRPNPTPKAVSVTSIARLGQAATQTDAGRRTQLIDKLRAELFHAAPPELPMLPSADGAGDRRRQQIVGEIVHQALQFDLLHQAPGQVLDTLGIYAWQLGLTDRAATEAAALEAFDLLVRADQQLADLIGGSMQIYRELPFSVQIGGRTINGQIDLLFFDGHRWTILDYKTDHVPAAVMYPHARRYYAQLGVYATAVRHITGQSPNTRLYYIRPARLITVDPVDWHAALDRLEADLDGLVK